MNKQMVRFKDKYTLQERLARSKKQLAANPNKIVVIVEKDANSSLPQLCNPRFLCEKNHKFNLIKAMLQKKIRESGEGVLGAKTSFFIFIKGSIPSPEATMIQIYNKYKDEDGFLYMSYGNQESL